MKQVKILSLICQHYITSMTKRCRFCVAWRQCYAAVKHLCVADAVRQGGGLKKGGKESKRKKGCKERGGKEKKTFCRCMNLRERGNKRERKLLENVFAAVRVWQNSRQLLKAFPSGWNTYLHIAVICYMSHGISTRKWLFSASIISSLSRWNWLMTCKKIQSSRFE